LRLQRLRPRNAREFRDALLRDPEAIETGFVILATAAPVPGRGAIHALARDERGRVVLVRCARVATPRTVARVLSQWDWLLSSLPFLNAFAHRDELDLVSAPRVMIVGSRFHAETAPLCSRIEKPVIEMRLATLVSDGDRRGVLVEPFGHRELQARRHAADPAGATPRTAPPEADPGIPGIPERPGPSSPAPVEPAQKSPRISLDPVKLTPEEIAEFRRLSVSPGDGAETRNPPRPGPPRTRFVEN